MALGNAFLTPLGLLGLASVIPLVILYLLRPKPSLVRLPTFAFLGVETEQATRHRFFERLRRDALFLFQLAVLVGVSIALATPYLSVPSAAVAEETVLVVDASASMSVESGGTTRFARAVDAAADAAAGSTTVVVAETNPRVVLRDGAAAAARQTVRDLRVTDAPGDLGAAVTAASTLTGPEGRIVVVSDFAGEGWQTPVEEARARGLAVDLRQFRGGGTDNVGIVDLSFADGRVTATVRNSGASTATRQLGFDAADRRAVQLAPGDVAVETFDVPPGGGVLRLTPSDSFDADDAAYVAAPGTAQVRVLLLTNDENTYLTTALGLVEEVDLTVVNPPTAVRGEYDVVVFGDVAPQRLLRGDLALARDTLADGGGVAVLAQEDLARLGYGDLLLLRPTREVGTTATATSGDDPLVAGIEFGGGEYVRGEPRTGRTLVAANDGTPLVAVADSGGGRVLYYGYLERSSSFRFNYLYPVFWKRATLSLAGRASLEDLNYRTGERLTFADDTTVATPNGRVTGTTVPLSQAGIYTVDGREVGASLLDVVESDVNAPLVTSDVVSGGTTGEAATASVPFDLTPAVVAVVLGVVAGEVLFMRRRGDI
ncbi:N-terminal double-transmembrane domain-containing protein [Halogranum amylolyticum]|uniref:N-terminal double-transmembrane domain-containing protein n=1 Tax=Halogranum amylolyticum TaxID=660520 RepID=A0A1H8W6I3_9EURY|nr:BatA domain-containing protein [Halogranum amylolyticum]SEP22728.1 N-terminal double-transmembrane domain-containing protein [Halogranum amylolyticum]